MNSVCIPIFYIPGTFQAVFVAVNKLPVLFMLGGKAQLTTESARAQHTKRLRNLVGSCSKKARLFRGCVVHVQHRNMNVLPLFLRASNPSYAVAVRTMALASTGETDAIRSILLLCLGACNPGYETADKQWRIHSIAAVL